MLKNGLKVATVLAFSVILLGCDPTYGVLRDADLEKPVELACVQHAIEATRGVEKVTFKTESKGTGLFHPEPDVHSFLFEGAPDSGVYGAVQIYQDYNGKFSYHAMQLYIGFRPRPEHITAMETTRPVMRAIEKNIASNCGVAMLPSSVHENCMRYTCKPFATE